MLNSASSPHLDHVFVTVDEDTQADIIASDILSDDAFCRFRIKKATSTLLGPYETANVLGESTFVEFFPKKNPPFPGISLGVVMSFDRPGEAAEAGQAFVSAGDIGFDFELNRREIPGHDDPQPWYRLVRPKLGDKSPLTLFLSEITESYFDTVGATRTDDGRQPRAAYLDAAVGTPHGGERTFRNITEAVIRLSHERARTFSTALKTLGYTYQEQDGDLVHTGPEATIRVTADDAAPEGLTSLTLELLSPDPEPGRSCRFGTGSVLTFSPNGKKDSTAIWTFTPLEIAT